MHLVRSAILRRAAVALLTLVLAALPLLGARPAQAAATFTVNLPGDAPDLNLNDNLCDASAGAGSHCTLRAAIQQANATDGRDTIRFNIPGGGLKTIRPNSQLPIISQAVTIDGYTQPGAKPNTLPVGATNAALRIEIDGSNAGPAVGLFVTGANTVVRGLTINRFIANVSIREVSGVRIEGCFLGTNAAGTVARDADSIGIQILSAGNVLGGTAPAARNLISGNGDRAVDIFESNNRVEGNLIGTASDGATALGNGGAITVDGSNVTVGGTLAAGANVIAFNGGDGVQVPNETGVRILRNSIFANDGLGINLGFDGATPNDPGDADTGANNFQNKPLLDQAEPTAVSGRLLSTPATRFVLRFFANPPAGDEGKTFLGQVVVTTDGIGRAAFIFSPAQPVPEGQTVTATATDPDGNTSEFSLPKVVQ